jgi:hypothetical protein
MMIQVCTECPSGKGCTFIMDDTRAVFPAICGPDAEGKFRKIILHELPKSIENIIIGS